MNQKLVAAFMIGLIGLALIVFGLIIPTVESAASCVCSLDSCYQLCEARHGISMTIGYWMAVLGGVLLVLGSILFGFSYEKEVSE